MNEEKPTDSNELPKMIVLPEKFGVNIPITKHDLKQFPNHSIIETGVYPNRRQRRKRK